MRSLAALFVGKPLHILLVAAVAMGAYLWARQHASAHPHRLRASLICSIGWALYAAWQWLVQSRTPEANIRVDLLVIWPVLGLLSLWSLIRWFR